MSKRPGNHIGDNIYSLRVDLGLSQAQIAEMAEVGQTTVSSWECGACTPRFQSLAKLATKLGIDFDLLASEEFGYASKTRDRRKAKAGSVCRKAPRRGKAAPMVPEVPILGTASAGRPSEPTKIQGLFTVPTSLRRRYPKAFFVRVEGESMNRRLPNGCLALVDPQQKEVDEHGAFAICTENSEVTIKRVRILPNGIELVPDSFDPSFKPTQYVDEEAAHARLLVLGRVVWMTAPLDYDV